MLGKLSCRGNCDVRENCPCRGNCHVGETVSLTFRIVTNPPFMSYIDLDLNEITHLF